MSTSPVLDSNSYKELYLRHLHKEGYPPTAEKLKEFNIRFYDDLGLEGDERKIMSNIAAHLRHRNIQKFSIPKSMEGNLELMKMFYEVAADHAKKWTTATSPAQAGTQGRSKNASKKDDRAPIKITSSIDSDVDMADIQEEKDEVESEDEGESEVESVGELNKLKEQLAEKDGEIMQLKNRNEELAKTLQMKDEECHQLEEQAERIGKTKESDMAQLMEEKRHLEERVRSLEDEKAGNVKESDVAKLEEKIRSLEETVRKKDQMLETALQVQGALYSMVNK